MQKLLLDIVCVFLIVPDLSLTLIARFHISTEWSGNQTGNLNVTNNVNLNVDVHPSSHDSVSSSSLLMEPVTSSTHFTVDQSVGVFYDCVTHSRGVGIRTSCFSLDPTVLASLLRMHGIVLPPDHSVAEMQYTILRHLLVGNCYRFFDVNRQQPLGQRCHIVCGQLSSCFSSATNMFVLFICCILSDLTDAQKLTAIRLSSISSALINNHFTVEPFSTPRNIRRDCSRLILRYLSVDCHDDQSILPSGLETMTKVKLHMLCKKHLVSFTCKKSVAEL